jgi:hypothetical protein
MKKYFIIAAVLMLAAGCSWKRPPVDNSQNPAINIERLSIKPSIQKDGWTFYYGQSPVVEVTAKEAISMELFYKASADASETSLGQMVSLSSRQYVWALPLNPGLSGASLWAVGKDVEGREVISADLGKFAYEQQFIDCEDYTNTTYGYTFKCPAGWKIDSSNPESIFLVSPQTLELYGKVVTGEVYGEGYQHDVNVRYYASVADEPENVGNRLGATTIPELIKKNPMITNSRQINFAGGKAYEVTWGGFGAYYVVLAEHNGHLFEVFFGNRAKAADLNPDEKEFLGSFKFVAPTPVINRGETILTGVTACLPHRNAQPGQPQTMECAIGLLEEKSGKYYSLKNSNPPFFDTGVKVKVTGKLEDDSNSNYDVVAAIQVSTIERE